MEVRALDWAVPVWAAPAEALAYPATDKTNERVMKTVALARKPRETVSRMDWNLRLVPIERLVDLV